MKNCTETLRNYRNQLNIKTNSCKASAQVKDHFSLVLSLIESYLKSVCDLYTKQKAIRVRRACEKQRLARLTASFSGKPVFPFTQSSSSDSRETNHSVQRPPDRLIRVTGEVDEVHSEDQALTPQEIQMFDQENTQLYDELNSLTDQVKVIGGQVMEIARLQEIFTEKVLQQENELDRLNSSVVASTESIRDGNEQLREAIKKGAGFRVWVLFFIITLAFTVLFLDWYNP